MAEEIKKKVDEDWKRRADEEKQGAAKKAEGAKPQQVYPDASFTNIVAWIAAQALVCLGEAENPATKRKEPDLAQARYLVDALMVLKQKSKGNLAAEEARQLEAILYDVQMAFVRAAETKKG